MTRFATLLILAPLLAIGCNRTPSAAQERPLAIWQPAVRSVQQASSPETAGSASVQDSKTPLQSEVSKAEKETRYLAFQIFT